jgi:hypothetical protein
MKIHQLPLVLCLLFLIILSGCTEKMYVFSNTPNTYNIIVPPNGNGLKDVKLVVKGNEVMFNRNGQMAATLIINPVPPKPCRCHPGDFRFIMLDDRKAIIYDAVNQIISPLDIANLPGDLKREIIAQPNQSFLAQNQNRR